jgi:hypothetical protein
VIGLDMVVGISVGAMPGRRQQLLQYRWVHRRVIGDDLGGPNLRGRSDDDQRAAFGQGCIGTAGALQ